jgi:hypothetical protein
MLATAAGAVAATYDRPREPRSAAGAAGAAQGALSQRARGGAHHAVGQRHPRRRFSAIRLRFELETTAGEDQLARLLELTERYCVVYRTLAGSPSVSAAIAPA